jgi:hypothetical protein
MQHGHAVKASFGCGDSMFFPQTTAECGEFGNPTVKQQ